MDVKYDQGIKLVYRFVNKVFPQVDKQLNRWIDLCSGVQDEILRTQALASISTKKFHAQGGSIYALYPNVDLEEATRFIVSLQTISDYLDNLCDRAGINDESAFRQLHLSMLDAVDNKRPIGDYYKYYPYKNDNNYLVKLVEECRQVTEHLPSYHLVVDTMTKYAGLYSELQTYKHLANNIREHRLITWARSHTDQFPDISCWEFAAATGSTLGTFMLYAASHDPQLTPDEVASIDEAYFPWICGLHILLDYYIDAQEDMQMGDLNFTCYYSDLKSCEDRLSFFIWRSLESCLNLRYPEYHITIVKGLLAMYLSDPKASFGLNNITSRNLIKNSATGTSFYHNLCKVLRFFGKL